MGKVKYQDEPLGIKRGLLCFHSGRTVSIDLEPVELVAELQRFSLMGETFLELIETDYGNRVWIHRSALERLDFIGNAYLPPSGIAIANQDTVRRLGT